MLEAHVVAALVNSTWQSALVALVAFGALRFSKRTSAAVRCTVWYGVLVVVALLPVADVTASLASPAPATARVFWRTPLHPITARVPLSFADPTAPQADPEPSAAERIALAIGEAAPWVERAWLAIALLLAARLFYETWRLIGAKRRVVPLDRAVAMPASGRAFRVGVSVDVDTPCVLGLFAPIVVLPASLAHSLSDDDLARVLLHEAAHVQRRDDWIHLLERSLSVVFFFNPLIYAIGRRLAVEREIACDDLAVARCGNRLAYASCLSTLAAYLSNGRPAPTPALFSGRRQLVVRVERLLDGSHDGSTRSGPRAFVALAAIAAAAFVVAHYGIPVRAQVAKVAARGAPVAAWAPAPKARVAPAPVAHRHALSRAALAPLPRVAPLAPAALAHHRHPAAPLRPVLHRSVSELIVMRKHDVSAKFVADVESALDAHVKTDDLVALREANVPPTYLASLKIAGVRTKCGFDFVRLHEHGVTPRVVATLQRRLGTMRVTIAQLVHLADAGS